MGALCCRPEEIDFEGPVDLWHFYLLRSVGKGAFGKVRVVQHKKTKELYALKYINKARISKQRAVNNIIQERRLLEEIDSPFVCNLRFAFQDDENLFMVLDLMLGGDLRFHLDRLGALKEDVVRFYVAEMALALDDLHSRGIVHRDLKPDNILLDERGHAHLTDFNIAVHFTERRALTSVAGSMAYMAPEVLAKRGYFSSVDWWSLGVVAYELLFGKRPYRGKTNSSLTQSILKEPFKLPENADGTVSPEGLDCIKGLLQRDIKKRLGCKQMGGIEAFKTHPWFRDYDWAQVEAKQATPPFEPDSKKANFDATHELEELLLEDNPLKAKKRNPNLDVSQLSADYRLMEQK
ncbi:kinase-like protein [Meredithblackwellia eburnea MCA 4105]